MGSEIGSATARQVIADVGDQEIGLAEKDGEVQSRLACLESSKRRTASEIDAEKPSGCGALRRADHRRR